MKRLRLPDVFAHGANATVTLLTILLALAPVPAGAQDADFINP